MEFDLQVPVIMGRPFLATSGALINVPAGEITFRIGDEREVFRVFKPLPICSYNNCAVKVFSEKSSSKPSVEMQREKKGFQDENFAAHEPKNDVRMFHKHMDTKTSPHYHLDPGN